MIKKFEKFGDSFNSNEIDEGMQYIIELLSKTIKNKEIDNYHVDNFEDYNLNVTIECGVKERYSEFFRIIKVMNDIQRDIIPQYESQFFMYQNKGKNYLEFEFIISQ